MFRRWTLLAVAASFAVGACAADTNTAMSDEEDLAAADAAIVAIAGRSEHLLYVRVPPKASSALANALIDAAKRGVDTRAVIAADGSFSSTWMLQQRVDTDVRPDHALDDVYAVSDDVALVPSSRGTAQKKGKAVQAFAKRFQDLLDAPSHIDGAKLQAPGKVTVHPMPESSRSRVVELFSAAQKSIDLEIYQLQDRAVVRALVEAEARGVKVRVMLEPKTVGSRNFEPVSKELAAAGIDVKPTPPAFDSHRNVDHAKLAVIDHKELFFGTGNLVRSGLGGTTQPEFDNRDFWTEDTRGPNVEAGAALFDADWERRDTSGLDALVLTPDNADDAIGKLIDGAKERLIVYNQSLNDDALQARLVAAAKRGVDVRVLLGYQSGFGGPPPNQAAVDVLRAAGAKADLLRKHYLHAKAIVADDKVYLGSQNFTAGGLRNNRELGEILDDPKAVSTVVEAFESDAK
jgi:cardiolipin synthase